MKVLLAIDGSEFGPLVIGACCDLIETGKIEAVKIVSVYEAQVPIAAEPLVVSSGFYQKLNELARGRAQATVAGALESIRWLNRTRPAELTTSVELGQPAALIVDIAKEWDADLIIVGSHGRGFWGRLALGSVSDYVVHHAPCSVMVVRKKRSVATNR